MGKGKPKSKGTKLQLGEFLGDNAGNTVNIGGKTVEMPSAPKAATLEIDITKVLNVFRNISQETNYNQLLVDDVHFRWLIITLS